LAERSLRASLALFFGDSVTFLGTCLQLT